MTETKASDDAGRPSIDSIAAAASITILDGFDALSISLMMPMMSREFGIPTASIGPIFASVMGGMVLGAFGGGAVADKLGRLRALHIALLLFGVTALTMPFVTNVGQIMLNRFIAGVGLGAAAPIAVALLNRGGSRRPSEFAVSLVWSGVAIGGILAALFNYTLSETFGWRLIFIVGGLMPIPIAIAAHAIFRGTPTEQAEENRKTRPRLSELFARGEVGKTLAVATMFFFGFVTTTIIVNWLPTILAHRNASSLLISASFAGINGGAVVGAAVLGLLASRGRADLVRTSAWATAALCGLAATVASLSTEFIAVLAMAGGIIGAGAQALSIALANELNRGRGLETTTVGFMAGSGRLGQFSGLGISSAVVTWTGQETMVFGLAGLTACIAALLSALVGRMILNRQTAPQH